VLPLEFPTPGATLREVTGEMPLSIGSGNCCLHLFTVVLYWSHLRQVAVCDKTVSNEWAHQHLRLIVSIQWSIGYGALCGDIILKEAQLVFWKCKKS
jgi:hypothetical protein